MHTQLACAHLCALPVLRAKMPTVRPPADSLMAFKGKKGGVRGGEGSSPARLRCAPRPQAHEDAADKGWLLDLGPWADW